MTITRVVTNSGSPFSDPSGNPAVNVSITFQLCDTLGNAIDAWDEGTGENITGIVTATTDDTGTFSVNLWPNDRGNTASRYLCKCKSQNISYIGFVGSNTGKNLSFIQFWLGETMNANFAPGEIPAGAINGVNVTYTLENAPISGSLSLVLDHLTAYPGVDYILTGNIITLTTPLQAGQTIYANSYRF